MRLLFGALIVGATAFASTSHAYIGVIINGNSGQSSPSGSSAPWNPGSGVWSPNHPLDGPYDLDRPSHKKSSHKKCSSDSDWAYINKAHAIGKRNAMILYKRVLAEYVRNTGHQIVSSSPIHADNESASNEIQISNGQTRFIFAMVAGYISDSNPVKRSLDRLPA